MQKYNTETSKKSVTRATKRPDLRVPGWAVLRPHGTQESPAVSLKCRFRCRRRGLGCRILYLSSSWETILLIRGAPFEQGGPVVLGNGASVPWRREAQQCVSEMPRNHQHRVGGGGGGGGLALAVKATLSFSPSLGTSTMCLLTSTAHVHS